MDETVDNDGIKVTKILAGWHGRSHIGNINLIEVNVRSCMGRV